MNSLPRKADKTGRSGSPKVRKPARIKDPFVPLTDVLLTAPAFMALGIGGRRVLDALMLEHLRQGRQENGRLAMPYRQLTQVGLAMNTIAAGVRELEAMGFITISYDEAKPGHRPLARYTLTFLPVDGAHPTLNFRRWTDLKAASSRAKAARRRPDQKTTRRSTGVERSCSTSVEQDGNDIPLRKRSG